MAAAADGDGVIGARTGTAAPLSTTEIFTSETAIGAAATTAGRIVLPAIARVTRDISRDTQAIVRQHIPDMAVRQLQPSQRTQVEALDRRAPDITAERDPAPAVLRRCRPILEIVQRPSRVRGPRRRELSPRLGRVNDPRLSRRARIRFLVRRGVARRVLAGIRVWQLKAEAGQADVASNVALRKFP
jgi:hypothetical protein